MKLNSVLCGVMLLSISAGAQNGQVIYERKTNMHKRLPPEAEQMRAMIPEWQVSKSILYYTPTTSLYKNLPEEEDQMPQATSNEGGRRVFMRFNGSANDETFRDYENEKLVESRELGPKKYLIEDSLKTMKWKLSQTDTMTVAGHLCYKATSSIEGMGGGTRVVRNINGNDRQTDSVRTPRPARSLPIVAWYAPDIETSAGPDNYFGLPGLILKLDMDEGFMVYEAKSITPADKAMVKAPTSGKKIAREEYRKLMMQEFGGRPGPGGGMTRQVIINQ